MDGNNSAWSLLAIIIMFWSVYGDLICFNDGQTEWIKDDNPVYASVKGETLKSVFTYYDHNQTGNGLSSAREIEIFFTDFAYFSSTTSMFAIGHISILYM